MQSSPPTNFPRRNHSWLYTLNANDLLCAILLIAIWFGLSLISPQTLYVPQSDSQSSYPYIDYDLISPIVSSIIIFPGAWLFLCFFKLLSHCIKSKFRFFHFWTALWTHIITVVLTYIIISTLNIFVGRVSPSFYARCGKITDPAECDVLTKNQFDELRKSFPAANPGAIMASMLYLTLVLQKMVKRRPSWVSCICMIFVIFAFFAGATSIRTYKHHTDDVVAGFVIGAIVCGFSFLGAHKRIFRHLKDEPSEVQSS